MSVVLFTQIWWLDSWAPNTLRSHLYWDCTWMYPKQAEWHPLCMICGFLMQATQFESPQEFIVLPKCWVMWGSVICCNLKQTAVGKLEMIGNFLEMCGEPCSSMLILDVLSFISFWNENRSGFQPHPMRVELLAMPNCNPSSTQWPVVWLIYSLMSTCLEPGEL